MSNDESIDIKIRTKLAPLNLIATFVKTHLHISDNVSETINTLDMYIEFILWHDRWYKRHTNIVPTVFNKYMKRLIPSGKSCFVGISITNNPSDPKNNMLSLNTTELSCLMIKHYRDVIAKRLTITLNDTDREDIDTIVQLIGAELYPSSASISKDIYTNLRRNIKTELSLILYSQTKAKRLYFYGIKAGVQH